MKCTRRKQRKSLKKTRKYNFRLVLKGGQYIDEENPEESLSIFEKVPQVDLKEYFCSEGSKMKIKSDITKVIHQLPQIRDGCVLISQNLQSFIFERWTPMLEYVFSRFDISIINEKIAPINTVQYRVLFDKIKTIFDQNKSQNRTTFMYYDAYTRHLQSNNITKEELKSISQLFYRLYLKGGSAMLFVVNEYQKIMKGETLTPTEIENILGGYSDFDFNFIINPMLPKEQNNPIHHNMLREISKKYIFDILQWFIYSEIGEIFRNEKLLDNISNHLLEHSPQIIIDNDHSPTFIGRIYNVEEIRNDPLKNRFATVTSNTITLEHPFHEEKHYRDNTFDLIRLLAEFKNITNPEECMRNGKYKRFIQGELIDVSIPHFDSHEAFDKWEEAKNIIPINNIYIYSLSAIIHDLERVVEENIKRGDPKLQKRQKRLKFFNDFACVLPQLINPDIGINYTTACETLFNEIFETESSFLTKENKESLTSTLVGIYVNFPQFIRSEKRNIFLLLKQYFKHKIDIPLDTGTLYELITPFTKQNKFVELEYDNSSLYKPSFYTFFTLSADKKIQEVFDLAPIVYNYSVHLIDEIEKVYNSNEKMQKDIKKSLSALLIEFNNIAISLNDNTMMYETIIQFVESLNQLLINIQLYDINSNYADYLTGQNIFVLKQKLHDQQLKKNEYTQIFMKKNHGGLLLQSLLLTKQLKQDKYIESKLVLKGGYLYDIYNTIQNAILKNENDFNISTNDMDMFMFVNQAYLKDEDIHYIYQSFKQLKEYLEKTKDPSRLQRICMYMRKQHNNRYVIQMIVYDYVLYNEFQSNLFTTILKNPPQNLYRIIESHTYELYVMNIYNHIEPNYYDGWRKPRYTLSDFIPDIKVPRINLINKWENFINKLNEFLKLHVTYFSSLPERYKTLDINIRELYVDSLLDIKKSYDEIMTSNKDVLKKEKYINRMLGYT